MYNLEYSSSRVSLGRVFPKMCFMIKMGLRERDSKSFLDRAASSSVTFSIVPCVGFRRNAFTVCTPNIGPIMLRKVPG